MKYVLAILLVALLIVGCTQTPQKKDDQTTQHTNDQLNSSVMGDNQTGYNKTQDAIAQAVADGNYEKEVTYDYHSGQETVDIKVTVVNDTITEASVTPTGQANPISIKIITNFNNALPELVVGKKITDLNIPKNVAGSSLTSAAFKQYVEGLAQK